MWTKNEDCKKVIEDTWKTHVVGCPMFVLEKKLKIIKSRLKDWNRTCFGNVHINVSKAEQNLKEIPSSISLQGYIDSLYEVKAKAQHDLETALNMVEEYWKEKAKINWTLHGDRNTKLYHTYAKIRRKINLISSLVIDDNVVTDLAVMENHIESHFKNLFNNNHRMQDNILINANVPHLLNDNSNAMLTLIPSADEIHGAVKNLNANSAPGPNGFGGIFYHTYWNIIKLDVINVVTQFFSHGWIMPNYNANTLVLIPKTKEASCLGQYRPIALANFKFKIISKILIERLSSILPNIISKEQKGFVSGRCIKDGICLTSEAINILQNKSFSGNVALKIDIAKAFDTLNWNFIIQTLKCFGFNATFCNWIYAILNSANLSIGFNGKQVGYFRGDSKSLNAIINLLKYYGNTSGQFCNFSKSLIYVGGMTTARHVSLANIIGFTIANPPFIHLGVIFKGLLTT
ncbi:uncharacterized protein LOC131624079 [Vicia villosa]|uniref:uncharacterized protein LOC131624079 n=1 Tax=Vicia villosa TaxID=3911 RepID=UPI00273CA562|nr:uncharacterized protein LOC131624079 [Vicia villosa]